MAAVCCPDRNGSSRRSGPRKSGWSAPPLESDCRDQPFEERRNAGGLEIVARLTSIATIGANARIERDVLRHEWSKSLAVQLAFKTVY